MPLSSSINVEAEVSKFMQLNSLFNKYQESVKKQPGVYSFYKNRIDATEKSATRLNKFLIQESVRQDKMSQQGALFQNAADKAGKSFQSVAKSAKDSAEYLAKSAVSLFQITTIAGATLGLVGSGFGVYVLDRSAGLVQDRRKQALGLGAPYGALQSFGTNFARYGIDAAALQGTATGLYDVTSPNYLPIFSTGSGKGNAADTTVELLKRLPALFAGVQDNMIGPTAERYGLTNILSIREIISYLHSSPEERKAQINNYERDKFVMNVSKEAQITWANFDTAMTRAGKNIESIFAQSLVPLAEPLTDLSASVTRLIGSMIDSGETTKAVQKFGYGIDWFSGEVESPEFKQGLKDFAAGVEGMMPYIKGIGNILKFAARMGIDAYKLWNDPNYNPTIGDIGKSILGGTGHPANSDDPNKRLAQHLGLLPPDVSNHHVPLNLLRRGTSMPYDGRGGSGWNGTVGEIPPSFLAQVQKANPNLSPQQCVELVQSTMGVGNVHDWRKGTPAKDAPEGAALATFGVNGDSNLYAYGGIGTPGANRDHALKMIKKYQDGSFDAVSQDSGHSAHLIHMPYSGAGGEGDAGSYYEINNPKGQPAGDNANLINQVNSNRLSGPKKSSSGVQEHNRPAKVSFMETLKGRKIPNTIVVQDETHGSVYISHNRISIAT